MLCLPTSRMTKTLISGFQSDAPSLSTPPIAFSDRLAMRKYYVPPWLLTAVPRNGIVIGYSLKVRTSKQAPYEHSSLGDLFVHLEGTEDVDLKQKISVT